MPTDFPPEDRAAQALRDGLHAQPVPTVSPDFDARVLAALSRPTPWHERLWPSLRPVILSAAASLPVTLLLLHWTFTLPVTAPPITPPVLAQAPVNMPSLDALLDRPNLCEASLEQAWQSPAPPSTPPDRRAEPQRHAALLPTPSTIA